MPRGALSPEHLEAIEEALLRLADRAEKEGWEDELNQNPEFLALVELVAGGGVGEHRK